MERLITNLDTNLGPVIRDQLDENFKKLQNGVDGQSDSVNKQIKDMLGDVPLQDQNEVTQARIDANGEAYSTMKSRLDVDQVTAQTALEEERLTKVEVESARVNSAGETHDSLKERIDKDANKLTQQINQTLSQISLVPETFSTVNELNHKYPTGKPGLFIVTDTRHKYIWENNKWTDVGNYQAVTLARNGATMDKVDTINPSQVINTFAVPASATGWNGGTVIADKNRLVINPGKNTDFGAMIPVFLSRAIKKSDNLYINLNHETSSVTDNDYINHCEIWLADLSGKLIKPLNVDSFYAKTTVQSYQLIVNGESLMDANVGTDFTLIIAYHNNAQLTITDFIVNFDNSKKDSGVNKLLMNKIEKHPYFSSNFGLFQNGTVTFIKVNDSSVNPVVQIPYYGIDLDRNVYVRIETYTDYNTTTKAHYWISKLSADMPNGDIEKGYDVLELTLTPSELKQTGVAKDGMITLTTGKQPVEGMIIYDVQVSNDVIVSDSSKVTRKQDRFGQPVDILSNATMKEIADVDLVTPKQPYNGQHGILKSIDCYVDQAGNYIFTIGKIDQNNLLVNETKTISLKLVDGMNHLELESHNLTVPSGAQLFMTLGSAHLYTTDATHLNVTKALIRDKTHPTTNPGYSGQMLYEADVLIPFSYDVIEKPADVIFAEYDEELADSHAQIATLTSKLATPTVVSPAGKRFLITVSDDGVISANSLNLNKLAVFGNSLTKYDQIGGFGLAASNQDSDWFAYVKKYISNDSATASITRNSLSDWESMTNGTDRQAFFDQKMKPTIDSDTDLVIIQAGDNVNTQEKANTFPQDTKKLIQNIRAVATKARIIWVGCWFVSTFDNVDLIASIKTACAENSATFIDIRDLAKNTSNNSFIGAQITKPDGTVITVDNNGYAIHPGDAGHKKIADLVISQLNV